jgi:SAM-dependent methyltransferase
LTLNDKRGVREQYKDTSNFDVRVGLHVKYSVNPIGWNRWMLGRVDVPADAAVLEVGCGPAFLWRETRAPDGWTVIVSDMSLGMARAAKDHVDADVVVSDAQSLPWASESFDAVIANHMLYHVPDIDAALSEFNRVLRPGGRLFAATNGHAHFREVRDLLETHWRYIGIFGLENGPELVAKHFDDVAVERYEDALEVPEVDPVVAYVTSMSTFWNLDTERKANLRRVVADEIAARGTFHITKDAGLITARRP